MKGLFKFVGFVIFAILVTLGVAVGAAFVGRQAIAASVDVNGIRVIRDGTVSIGVVPVGPGRVALIDAGSDRFGQAIVAELTRRELDKTAVIAILLTHGHGDHTAAIPLFPSAKVMALDREAAMVQGTEGSKGPLTRFFPVGPTGIAVDVRLEDGERVRVGDTEFEVFAVPGHTQGSAAYLVKSVLFMGDAADASRDGDKIIGASWAFSDSQAQGRESLAALEVRLREADPEIKAMVFAHSGILSGGFVPLSAFVRSMNP